MAEITREQALSYGQTINGTVSDLGPSLMRVDGIGKDEKLERLEFVYGNALEEVRYYAPYRSQPVIQRTTFEKGELWKLALYEQLLPSQWDVQPVEEDFVTLFIPNEGVQEYPTPYLECRQLRRPIRFRSCDDRYEATHSSGKYAERDMLDVLEKIRRVVNG